MHIAITGASSGIGAGFARAFAARGASLSLVARRRELLAALAETLPTSTHLVPCDLSDPSTATAWLAPAEAALGPIDVLINNAGAQVIAPCAEVDVEAGERSLRLNLHTPLRL
ncbi:MAG: SDR family NAD(P)-dependent oxidoreductase, partial [Myxococcales bacterium]|nr:SDR family NAD(P)-dependent oxidoreductase [Myxococcales bacterium]